jgi:hypothetical protein
MSDIQNLASVFPVADMAKAVSEWSAILGVAPTFVDGDRWAQFDVNGRRVALAGTDRVSNAAGLMIKVTDIEAASDRLTDQGVRLGPLQEGPHELRRLVESADGWALVLYAAKP